MTKKLRTAQVDIPPLGTAASYDVGTSAGEIALIGAGGTVPINNVATGTPSGKKFVRDDSTLVEINGRLFSGIGVPPPASPQLRAQSVSTATAGPTSFTVPATVQPGDLILVYCAWAFWTGMTPPAGWTQLATGNQSPPNSTKMLIAKVCVSGDAGATFSYGGSAGYAKSISITAWSDWSGSLAQLVVANLESSVSSPVISNLTKNTVVVTGFGAPENASFDWAGKINGTYANSQAVAQGSAVMASDGASTAVTPTKSANVNGTSENHSWTVAIPPTPASSSSSDGDYYLNKSNGDLYGPMATGAWGTPTGLATQAELDALAGTIYSGTDTPPAGTGATGDYYHSTNLKRLYGPKGSDSAWGSRSVTPTFRAASTAAIGDAGNSLGCTAPTGLQVGDVMVAVVATHVGVTPTGPTGWTALVGSGTTHSVWWKIAVSGDIGATFTWSNGGTNAYMAIAIAAYSGVDGTGPVDVVTAFGATATTPTLTPTSGSAVVLDIWTNSGSGTAVIGSPAGTMQRASVLNSGNGWASINISDEVHDNTVTTARTATGGGGTWGSLQVALLTPLVSSYAELSDSIATQAELDVVASRVTTLEGKIPPPATVFTMSGAVATQVGGARLYNDTGRTLTISAVRASLGTAGSTDTTVDINKDGTTIFTTQANRPNLAAAAVTVKSVAPDVTTWEDGSYLTVDVDAAGTSADTLTVTVVVTS